MSLKIQTLKMNLGEMFPLLDVEIHLPCGTKNMHGGVLQIWQKRTHVVTVLESADGMFRVSIAENTDWNLIPKISYNETLLKVSGLCKKMPTTSK